MECVNNLSLDGLKEQGPLWPSLRPLTGRQYSRNNPRMLRDKATPAAQGDDYESFIYIQNPSYSAETGNKCQLVPLLILNNVPLLDLVIFSQFYTKPNSLNLHHFRLF